MPLVIVVIKRLVLFQQLHFLFQFEHARSQVAHFALQLLAALRLGQALQFALQPRRILVRYERGFDGTARARGLECYEGCDRCQ